MYWNSEGCSLTACSFTNTDHVHINARTHTHNHTFTWTLGTCSSLVEGWEIRIWFEMRYSAVLTNVDESECVCCLHACSLMWWRSWLQRAGVCESISCEFVCALSSLLRWWSQKPLCVCVCLLRSLSLLPVVAGDVVDPEGVADVLLAFVLVFAEARQDVDLIELRVDGGSLGKARHRHCGGKNNNDKSTERSTQK